MRGIAELVEVTKRSPPTPSPGVPPAVPPSQQFNIPPAAEPAPPSQQYNGVGGALPLEDLPPEQDPPPEDTSKTPEPTVETIPPTPPPKSEMGSANFARMKSLLEQNMGISTEGQEVTERSPSSTPSPVVQRRAQKAAPPPPKRGPQTSLGVNRHSYSSSTSSLSSNQSERVNQTDGGAAQIPPAKMVPVGSPSRRELPRVWVC